MANAGMLLKALFWTLLTFFTGLLQLWLLWANRSVNLQGGLPFDDVVLSGAILFFSTAIVTALAFDYYFNKTPRLAVPSGGVVFALFPAIVIILSIWNYDNCFGKSACEIDFTLIVNVQIAVTIMTGIYAIGVKFLQFKRSVRGAR